MYRTATALAAVLLLAGCGKATDLPASATYGADVKLVAPDPDGPVPTLNPAKAVGWPAGAAPVAPAGFKVGRFADGLDHPRWLYQLANGDVLVAESNSPARPVKGITDWVAARMMKRAGAGVASANRITLLRDADGDGVAETKTALLTGLNSPFGMAVIGDWLYVGDTDAVRRWPFKAGQTTLTGPGEVIADLPAGTPNNHWARNLLASPDGKTLYVTVGSNSNIAEGGMDKEAMRANILTLDLETRTLRVFASGLRNPNGLAFEPVSGALWTTVNERDMLGDNLVPDYMTSVRDGGHYGWPWSYFGQHVDDRVQPQRPDMVAKAIVPDYALGAHTASLGLAFYPMAPVYDLAAGATPPPHFPQAYVGGAFIGQHGSWNRKPVSGYKVVFVPFQGGKPAGATQDFLIGFLDAKGQAQGRPVGVLVNRAGALLVADDVGNVVWRVAASK
ncbi:MAG: sorbosone dehydrogenase family protein [Caulobacter sp.]|nr:sorbosone dehydrogenase family protein [Caulobacter sp.]